MVVHRSHPEKDVAAHSPVEVGDHSLVEAAGRILAEAADHSLAGDVVAHNLAAVVAGHIPVVAAVAGGIAAGHSHQKLRTAQAEELHTVLVADRRSHLLVVSILSRPGCHMTSQLRLRAS